MTQFVANTLVVVDAHSKWQEIFPVNSPTTALQSLNSDDYSVALEQQRLSYPTTA
ncbi:hypothetical protein CSKR_200001, partial [Clonorchis sinensis]